MSDVVGGVKIRIEADATGVESQTQAVMEKLRTTVTKQASSIGKSLSEKLTTPFKDFADKIPRDFDSTWSTLKIGASNAARTAGNWLSTNLSKSFDFIKGAASVAFVAVGGIISANLGKAIERADILNNFPKVMENIGFSADDARLAIDKIKDSLDGLPTSTQAIASVTQALAPLTGSVEKAADVALSMNNALLAGGAAFGVQENAMAMYRNMMSRGTVDMMSWRSIQTAMPGQLDQMAVALLGATAKSSDLYDAMQDGTVSFDQFNDALIALNAEGIEGFASFEEQARAATGGIGTAVKNMGNRVAAAMEKVMTWFGVDTISNYLNAFSSQFGGWAEKLIEWLEKLKKTADFDKLKSGLAPLLGIATGLGAGFLSWLPWVGPMFKNLTGPVGFFIGMMVQMWQNSEVLRTALGNVFEKLKSGFGSAQPILEKLSELFGIVAKVLGDILGEVINAAIPVFETLITVMGPVLTAVIDGIVAALGFLGPILQNLAPIIVALTAAWKALNFVMSLNIFTLIVAGIAAVVAGLVWFFTQTEIGKTIVEKVWSAIKTAISAVVNWWESTAYPIIQTVVSAVGTAWEWLRDTAITVWEWISTVISDFVDWFSQHVYPTIEAVIELIVTVWEVLKNAAQSLIDFLSPIFSNIAAGWEWLWGVFSAVWEVVGAVLLDTVSTAWDTIANFLETTWNNIQIAFETVWNQIVIVFTTVWDAMKIIVETVIAVIKGIIETVTAVIKGDWEGAWEAIRGTFETVWNAISGLASTFINAVKNTISNVLSGIKAAWDNTWNGIKTFFSSIWEGIKNGATNGINAVYTTVTNIKNKILGFFAGAASWLWDAGKNVVQGLLNGIGSLAGTIGQWFLDKIPSWIVGPFKFALGISSPSRVFRGFGRNIVEGLGLGIETSEGLAVGASEHLAGAVVSTMEESLSDVQDVFSKAVLGEGLSDSLADGILAGQSEVVRAAEAITKAAAEVFEEIKPLEMGFTGPIVPLTTTTTPNSSNSPIGAARGLNDGSTAHLSREDLDYLVEKLAEVLGGMAQSASLVTDLALNGQNRSRRGSF